MTPPPRIGVLVAAGRSRRMGRSKPLLPWPPAAPTTTLIAAAFDAISPVCAVMVVVLGREADAVTAALGDRSFTAVPGEPDLEMLDSIRCGLIAARALDPGATIVLQPGDHPAAAAETLSGLIAQVASRPGCAVMPEHAGRGGHPVLIPAPLIGAILAAPPTGGLRRFWIEHPDRCVRVPVDDPSVIEDIDRPEDCDALR